MKIFAIILLTAVVLTGCFKPSLSPDGGTVLAPCSGPCKTGCELLKGVADGATGGLVSMGCVLFCESPLVKTMCDDAVNAKLDSWGWLSKLKDKLHEAATEVRRMTPGSICLHCKPEKPEHAAKCKAVEPLLLVCLGSMPCSFMST